MAVIRKGGIDESLRNITPDDPQLSDKLRTHWGAYLDWLDTKGLRGKPELDSNDLGGKMIDEYRKQFPETLV